MTTKQQKYIDQTEKLLATLDGESALSDTEYIEVLEEIDFLVSSRIEAKLQELRRANDDD